MPKDKLAQFRSEESKNKDGFQLDLFHYLDDPIITENKLPKLIKDETLEDLSDNINSIILLILNCRM